MNKDNLQQLTTLLKIELSTLLKITCSEKSEKQLTNIMKSFRIALVVFEKNHDSGDWSNGMIGVSKTFGGSSILSSPARQKVLKNLVNQGIQGFFLCPFQS